MENTINWNATKKDTSIILKIARRANKMNPRANVIDTQMDLTACHLNGTELKLQELLDTDDFNFSHDVFGINRHMNRDNAQLTNCFLPRFSK